MTDLSTGIVVSLEMHIFKANLGALGLTSLDCCFGLNVDTLKLGRFS